ncbi:hypothetical protein L810_6080 [Burkholderia sp. AU4i]|nr:hypothetical protein L810_6080 [Burkholderia sp. AU4i]
MWCTPRDACARRPEKLSLASRLFSGGPLSSASGHPVAGRCRLARRMTIA